MNYGRIRWAAIKYFLPLFIYLSTWQSFHQQGVIIFLPLIIAFVLIPGLELFFAPDPSNLSDAEEAVAKRDPLFDLLLYAIVPLQYLVLFVFLQDIDDPSLQTWEKVGRIMVMGLSCGTFGINVGHELGHRSTWYEQAMAKALLLTSLYTHFFIEHNRGHHKHVATASDPSSAPYRVSLYRFWIRSISGVYRDAWKIANASNKKAKQPWWRNEMLQLQLLSLVFIACIYFIFGLVATASFLVAALIGVLLLETVNYIEHYGLQRKQTSTNSYERAMPWHSWNSNHVIGRMVLFELSRHSDHHYLASRKYQVLRHHEDAPQLPTGYPGSMLLATIPPLWFAVMDRQMQKFNIDIPKENRL